MFKVESQDHPEEGKRARYVYAPNSWSADRIRDGGMDPMTVIGVRPKGMFVGARGCPLDKKVLVVDIAYPRYCGRRF